jgi:hypothetical protein
MSNQVDTSAETDAASGGTEMKKNGATSSHKSEVRRSRDAVSEVIRQAGLAVQKDELVVADAIKSRTRDEKKSQKPAGQARTRR